MKQIFFSVLTMVLVCWGFLVLEAAVTHQAVQVSIDWSFWGFMSASVSLIGLMVIRAIEDGV